jgi:hypothetical protein
MRWARPAAWTILFVLLTMAVPPIVAGGLLLVCRRPAI